MTDIRFANPVDEWVRVSFRYDPEAISIIKGASYSLRRYDPSSKSWSVHESIAEPLVDALIAAGHQVLAGDEPPPMPKPTIDEFFGVDGSDDVKALVAAKVDEVIAMVPAHLMHKVFRGLSRKLYPELFKR